MSDQDLKTELPADQAQPLFTIGERNFSKDDAVTKITNADSFIEQLKAEGKTKDDELAQLRAQIDQSTKLDDALARMNSTQGTSETLSQEAPTSAIDIEALKKELLGSMSESLSQKDRDTQAQKNQEDSISAAQAIYGSSYESKLRERAKQLGMSDADIISEASSNPIKFKSLFGLDKQNLSTPSLSFGGSVPRTNNDVPVLKLGGFSAKEQVSNLKETFTSFAKARGVDPESMFKF
tara:strand:+ start:5361 stop:6071 length:711 start_codon:yes stop_codon:yes gene_type:complete